MGPVTALDLAVPLVRHMSRRAGVVVGAACVAASCSRSPSGPAPTSVGAIASVRYEHVSNITLESDTRVEFEFWDCRRLGALPGIAGPDVCLLTHDTGNVYRCPVPGFMTDASTSCDSSVVVRLRTPSGNPFFATGHDIFVNGTRVSRLRTVTGLDYPQEIGDFSIGSDGRIR
jgi:hypothetical protein